MVLFNGDPLPSGPPPSRSFVVSTCCTTRAMPPRETLSCSPPAPNPWPGPLWAPLTVVQGCLPWDQPAEATVKLHHLAPSSFSHTSRLQSVASTGCCLAYDYLLISQCKCWGDVILCIYMRLSISWTMEAPNAWIRYFELASNWASLASEITLDTLNKKLFDTLICVLSFNMNILFSGTKDWQRMMIISTQHDKQGRISQASLWQSGTNVKVIQTSYHKESMMLSWFILTTCQTYLTLSIPCKNLPFFTLSNLRPRLKGTVYKQHLLL